MAVSSAVEPGGAVLYDGTCGFCSWWVPHWQPTLARAGFVIAPLQSPQCARDIDLDTPEAWDLGADTYRHVMRRVWWAYPLYLHLPAMPPGLGRLFNSSYATFARNRDCVSRACGLNPSQH